MIDIDFLNFNSVETLPGFEARAAFIVNSASVFREDVDIVPTIVVYNISNSAARRFYRSQGLYSDAAAFEQGMSVSRPLVMQCRHCLRYALGYCVISTGLGFFDHMLEQIPRWTIRNSAKTFASLWTTALPRPRAKAANGPRCWPA